MRTGFRLPSGSAGPIYIQTIAGIFLGFALLYFLGHSRNFVLIASIAFTTVLGAAWYHAHRNWVYLTEKGIEGASRRGDKACISWSEAVSLKKGSDWGIRCIVLATSGKDRVIIIPLPIANSQEFKTVLSQFAPQNHPLNHVVTDAL